MREYYAVYAEQQHYRRALENGRRALTLARELGDRIGEARALCNVSRICHLAGLGRYSEALGHFLDAIATAKDIGDRSLEIMVQSGLHEVTQLLLPQGSAPIAGLNRTPG